MFLKYVLAPTVLYLEDVEAVGGGVLLEEIIARCKGMVVFNGTLYMCGKHWNVELIHYKNGKGRIIDITEPGKRKIEIIAQINKIMENKMLETECTLFKVRSRRSINRIKGRIISLLSIICTYEAMISYIHTYESKILLCVIAGIISLVSSLYITNKIVRG